MDGWAFLRKCCFSLYTCKILRFFLTLLLLLAPFLFVAFAAIPYIFTGAVWALACFTVGLCAGFVFSFPKVVQNASKSDSVAYRLLVNTNLEEISDWLTKAVVGIGLIQAREIGAFIYKVSLLFSKDINGGLDGAFHGWCLASIVLFLVYGFLFGFIYTRLVVNKAFAVADTVPELGGKLKKTDENPDLEDSKTKPTGAIGSSESTGGIENGN